MQRRSTDHTLTHAWQWNAGEVVEGGEGNGSSARPSEIVSAASSAVLSPSDRYRRKRQHSLGLNPLELETRLYRERKKKEK